MTLPSITRSGGPNFLGAEHAPFVAGGDPNSKGFKVRDVVLPSEISDARGLARRDLRHSLDRMKRLNDAVAEDPAVSFDTFYGQAVDLIASKPAQEAFRRLLAGPDAEHSRSFRRGYAFANRPPACGNLRCGKTR
jgi:hypothetical protein